MAPAPAPRTRPSRARASRTRRCAPRNGTGGPILLVNDAVAALEGTIAWDDRTRSYEVKLKGRTAVFGAESPIAVVDTKVVNLASPVRASSLGAWAEPEFFVKVLGPLAGQALAWDRATRTLSAKKSDVLDVAVESSVADLGDLTKIVLRFSQSPSYAVETTPDQVVLHFPGARLTAPSPERLLDSPRVARLLVRGERGDGRVPREGPRRERLRARHAAPARRGRDARPPAARRRARGAGPGARSPRRPRRRS